MNHPDYQVAQRFYTTPTSLQNELQFDSDRNYLFELPNWTMVSANGQRANEFLQGQLTADLRLVTDKQIQQSAMCNLKGRVLLLTDIVYWQGLKLVMQKDMVQETCNSLSKAAMLSRVTLREETSLHFFGLQLNNQNSRLPEFALPQEPFQLTATDNGFCYSLGNQLFFCALTEQSYSNHVQSYHNSQQVKGSLAWHYLQLRNKRISIYPESRGLFLPHRLDLHKNSYISFDKGCYKGQEIIARTHYRAKLKHHLQLFKIKTEQLLLPGNIVYNINSNQEIGELIDFCPINKNQYLVALSILFEHPNEVIIEGHEQPILLNDLSAEGLQ